MYLTLKKIENHCWLFNTCTYDLRLQHYQWFVKGTKSWMKVYLYSYFIATLLSLISEGVVYVQKKNFHKDSTLMKLPVNLNCRQLSYLYYAVFCLSPHTNCLARIFELFLQFYWGIKLFWLDFTVKVEALSISWWTWTLRVDAFFQTNL